MSTTKRRRVVTRHKVLVVPYIRNRVNTSGKRLSSLDEVFMVRDVRTKEWGFISGGVKASETSLHAAIRELNEETSNTIVFPTMDDVHTFSFVTLYRPDELLNIDKQRNEIVRSMYTVYMFEISLCDKIRIIKEFTPNREVSSVYIDTFDKFTNVWDFCEQVYHEQINC